MSTKDLVPPRVGIELACKRLIRQMFSRAAAEVTPRGTLTTGLLIPVDTARYAVQKTQASHRLCRSPAHERVNLADTAAGNRPYAHAFRCPAQRCYGAAAFTNTSLVPADRAGSRNARRNRPVAGGMPRYRSSSKHRPHFPNRVQMVLGPTAGLNGASRLPFRPDRLQHDVQLAAPTAG